jgi:integrase
MWHPTRAPLPVADLALRSQTDGATLTIKAGPKSSQVVKKLAPGIYTHGTDAYRFFARVRTKLESHIFRPPIPLSLVGVKDAYRQWRDTLVSGPPRPPTHRGTFAADISTYLTRVSSMPTIKERTRHLDLWATALGRDRPRASITATEVDAVLQGWLSAGLAPQTVKLRRGALAHVWSILDGKHATSPVKSSQKPPETPAEARAITPEIVQAILGAMRQSSKAKLRLRMIATTGLPHKQLAALTRADVDFTRMAIRATKREKGKGAPGGWRPISDAGMEAVTAFDRANLYGDFSRSTVYRAFRLACDKAGIVTNLRPYDLRHSYGTWLYDATGDLATVAHLMGCSLKTAVRYTLGARMAVAQRAVGALQLPEGFGAKVHATAKPRGYKDRHVPNR